MQSMTGMGRSSGYVLGNQVLLEVKSVNHRYCEVNVRMPSKYIALELKIQKLVKSLVTRGKVDLFLFEEKSESSSDSEIEAYKKFYDHLNGIRLKVGIEKKIEMQDLTGGVSQWLKKQVDTDQIWQELQPILVNGIQNLIEMRNDEGLHTKQFLKEHFLIIKKIKNEIQNHAGEAEELLTKKLKERISHKLDSADEIDPERLHTEVVFYLDRLDINEELQRLESHFQKADEFLENQSQVIGRKFDFLLQEFNREFNTIASKSQISEISHLVVDAKSELEKVREQIQNIQ